MNFLIILEKIGPAAGKKNLHGQIRFAAQITCTEDIYRVNGNE